MMTKMLLSEHHVRLVLAHRDGEGGGKVFPGPATFGAPRHRSKILKRVFQMASL